MTRSIDPQQQQSLLPAVLYKGPNGFAARDRDEQQRAAFEKARREALQQDRYENRQREERISSPFYDRFGTFDRSDLAEDDADFFRQQQQNRETFQGQAPRETPGSAAFVAAVYAYNDVAHYAGPNPGGNLNFVA